MTIVKRISALLLLVALMQVAAPADAARPAWADTLEVSGGVMLADENGPPFWMLANQQGRISNDSGSGIFTRLRLMKQAEAAEGFDWTYGIDLTARTNGSPDLIWTDAYAGLAYKKLRLTVGQKAEVFGLADPLLTLGSEVYSRNAPTIPKIALSTDGYVGITEWLAFNAYLAHGWMGGESFVQDAYLHQKFLYLRFGGTNPDKGVNFYAGLHDLAVWGGEGKPKGFGDFVDVFLGNSGGAGATLGDQQNALGDHRGTVEFALEQKGHSRDWLLYAQTMFEDGSGTRFWYPGDYLLGASLINKNPDSRIARINLEYLDTRSTGKSPTGPDNYLTNGEYGGWVYEGFAIGHPFIRFTEGANHSFDPQNRVRGMNGSILMGFSNLFNPLVRVAWIENHGSFNNPLPRSQQTSVFAFDLTNTTTFARGWSLTQQISLDTGESMDPNLAVRFTIAKKLLP